MFNVEENAHAPSPKDLNLTRKKKWETAFLDSDSVSITSTDFSFYLNATGHWALLDVPEPQKKKVLVDFYVGGALPDNQLSPSMGLLRTELHTLFVDNYYRQPVTIDRCGMVSIEHFSGENTIHSQMFTRQGQLSYVRTMHELVQTQCTLSPCIFDVICDFLFVDRNVVYFVIE